MYFVRFGLLAAALAVVGCSPDYSPNVYSGVAMQQANKVERGVVVGFRQVEVRSDGTIGAVAGGAAGGVLGSQAGDTTVTRGLGTVGGALVGGLVGTTVEHTTGDTTGWEYIVSESNGDLISVTQRQPKPIPLGQHVLVIAGKQARIVPDYATTSAPPTPPAADRAKAQGPAPAASAAPTPVTPASAAAAVSAAALQSLTPSSASSAPPSIPAAAFVSPLPASAPAASPSSSSGNGAASMQSTH